MRTEINTCGFCGHYNLVDPDNMTNPCDRDGEEREPTDTCIGWVRQPVSSVKETKPDE